MDVRLIGMTQAVDEEKMPEYLAAKAAGVCVGRDASARGLATALASGHESVIEHISFTFEIMGISRVTLAQLTRHRMASFSVESQRYVMQEEREAVVPVSISQNEGAAKVYETACKEAQAAYERMIEMGIPREDARYILPEGMQTHVVLTMNARELRHFFALRCCKKAQWEIREMAEKMLKICKKQCPPLFANAGAPCKRGKCPETRPCKGAEK